MGRTKFQVSLYPSVEFSVLSSELKGATTTNREQVEQIRREKKLIMEKRAHVT